MGPLVRLTIDSLGGGGDGIARHQDQPVFVPRALPGEDVAVRLDAPRGDGIRARLDHVIVASPDRVAAPCPHYGPCGGCRLQHLAPAAYAGFKTGLVRQALDRQGLAAVAVAPAQILDPASRRRITWSVAGGSLGLMADDSHTLVPIATCLVLTPALADLIQPLTHLIRRAELQRLHPTRIQVQESAGRIDVLMTLTAGPDLDAREALAGFARDHGLGRLAIALGDDEPEPLAAHAPPVLGDQPPFDLVPVPPGSFLQAAIQTERLVRAAVAAAAADLPAGRPVADLFSGLGSLGLVLAHRHPVTFVDGAAPAAAALAAALKRLPQGHLHTIQTRNLMADPLSPVDIARFGLVILDPPRAGAFAQVRALAAARANGARPKVMMVSCHPGSLARDLKVLLDAGFDPGTVYPIDQFVYTDHIESFVVLS